MLLAGDGASSMASLAEGLVAIDCLADDVEGGGDGVAGAGDDKDAHGARGGVLAPRTDVGVCVLAYVADAGATGADDESRSKERHVQHDRPAVECTY